MGEVVFDYTRPGWGHAVIVLRVEDEGKRIRVGGWGGVPFVTPFVGIPEDRPKAGSLLKLPNGGTGAYYRVAQIEFMRDPPDQWFATCDWLPAGSVGEENR